jgi:serine/threonine-protein kinase
MINASVSGIQIGSRLGPYHVLQQLGSGGAGNVFVAENTETGEKVALKVLRPGADEVEEIHARFIREISVAQKLNDPHIVEYRDCGVEDGVLYYAMEHVPWGSLADVLRSRGTLSWRDASECGLQIAQALSHLHELGIVHRDLKPANVFLSDTGRLKIGDFGLARDYESPKLTVSGMTVGTAKYLSPEQARGEQDIDARADLYSLGCNLFELIVGRTPFETPDSYEATSFVEMMRRHIQATPPKLSDVAPHCPAALSDLISRLLAKDRSQRPGSAAEVAEQLKRILAGETSLTSQSAGATSSASQPSSASGSVSQAGDSTSEQNLTTRLRQSSVKTVEVSTGKLLIIVAVIILLVALAVMLASPK